jgi:ATP-binding protein involved in chromosome partitioning
MSTFICPHCGERTDLFGHGGARHEAEALGIPFLGEVPLDIAIRKTSDAGSPIIAAEPDGPPAAAFKAIANAVLHELKSPSGPARRPAPQIIIEG